ncbi:unnamed protein product [Ectocarpus sp. 12 AP-2014]
MGVLHYCYTLCRSLAEKCRGPTCLGRGVGVGGMGGLLYGLIQARNIFCLDFGADKPSQIGYRTQIPRHGYSSCK